MSDGSACTLGDAEAGFTGFKLTLWGEMEVARSFCEGMANYALEKGWQAVDSKNKDVKIWLEAKPKGDVEQVVMRV